MKYEEGMANGAPFKRAAFESFEDLEAFFLENLWGRKGIRSKVIGKVLLWTEKEA
jgi:hypothetical protein